MFEMPILVFFLALMRVITAKWIWQHKYLLELGNNYRPEKFYT